LRRGKSLAWALGKDAPTFGDLAVERLVLRRIDVADPAAQHRGRAGGERALVSGRIDAPGEPRRHHESRRAEVGRQGAGKAAASGGGDAGADDGDRAAVQPSGVPQGPDDRRRRLEGGEGDGEVGLAGRQQPGAHGLAAGDLRLGRGDGRNRRRRGAAGPAGHFRQGGEGLAGRSKSADQMAERRRPHRLGARQAQPGDAVGPVERGGGHFGTAASAPMCGSWPFSRRRMFS
jgi:hypothetical protein